MLASNLRLQRLFSEFKEQLDTASLPPNGWVVHVNFTSSRHIVPRRPSICKQVVLIKAIHTCRVNVPVPGTFSISVQAVATCAGLGNVKEKTPDARVGHVLGVSVPFCCGRGGTWSSVKVTPHLLLWRCHWVAAVISVSSDWLYSLGSILCKEVLGTVSTDNLVFRVSDHWTRNVRFGGTLAETKTLGCGYPPMLPSSSKRFL